MNITRLKITNLFGLKEYDKDGTSRELTGTNGAGKTSVLDAIRFALTNKSNREYIVRNGETEGEVLIETSNGLTINRKARTNQTDYKSVKKDGKEVPSPEAFLRDIFTELQLDPVKFMLMDKRNQNSIILDMIEYDWNLNTIKEWFGELVPDINYEQNILSILNDIQSEKGHYFTTRQDINRDARNKKAFVEEIAAEIPEGYQAEKWKNKNISELYTEIETIRHENDTIEKAIRMVENRDNKVRKFEADKEISTAAVERELTATNNRLEKDIASLENQIKAYKVELEGLAAKKADKLEIINQTYKANIAKYDAEVAEYEVYTTQEVRDLTPLLEEAKTVEKMKSHLNEFSRMVSIQSEIEKLQEQSESLTRKIEKARTLPGEILETATIPIKGLTVKNGMPLINGLPISNLSDGEVLDLCIDITVQKPNALQIVLIDGVEKLSTENRNRLYSKCKEKGLQFIATRTTDETDLMITEL